MSQHNNRPRDNASPTYIKWPDRLRSMMWRIRKNIQCGNNVVFKEKVEISICEGGNLEIGDNSFIHAYCYFLLTKPNPSIRIGRGVYLGRHTIIASKSSITIGDHSIFAPYCYIIDHAHGFMKNELIINQRSVLGAVHIGEDCYFGTRSVILPDVRVGNGAIIGANSVVTTNIPSYEVWGGNPAKFIKKR